MRVQNLKFISLPVSEIIVIGVLARDANPNLREEKVIGDRGWNSSKKRC